MPERALKLLSSMATRELLIELIAQYERKTGQAVTAEAAGGVDVAKRVRAGEAVDVVVLSNTAIDSLIAAGSLLPESRVVAAFHHVSAVLLLDPEIETIDSDVLVLGDDRYATDTVQALAARIPGVRGVYAGRLRNCGQVEALTANLVSINRRYKAHAGLRITDI